MEIFPDPLSSPAHYTRTLWILNVWPATPTSHWLRAFRNVVRLNLVTPSWDEDRASLVSLHGLWPTLRSIHLSCFSIPPSEVFGLVCSFPLLEDLALAHVDRKNNSYGWNIPSVSPKLTGSLSLWTNGGSPLLRTDCWSSRMVSTSRRSCWGVTAKQISSR